MIKRRLLTAAGAVALAVGLTGCYEATSVTFFQPGEYRGADDPLLAKLEDPEFRAELDRRFDGQRDR